MQPSKDILNLFWQYLPFREATVYSLVSKFLKQNPNTIYTTVSCRECYPTFQPGGCICKDRKIIHSHKDLERLWMYPDSIDLEETKFIIDQYIQILLRYEGPLWNEKPVPMRGDIRKVIEYSKDLIGKEKYDWYNTRLNSMNNFTNRGNLKLYYSEHCERSMMMREWWNGELQNKFPMMKFVEVEVTEGYLMTGTNNPPLITYQNNDGIFKLDGFATADDISEFIQKPVKYKSLENRELFVLTGSVNLSSERYYYTQNPPSLLEEIIKYKLQKPSSFSPISGLQDFQFDAFVR